MDKRREELEEQKADLHLAMLMDEYAERMGKQVREEAEAAFERGELELPPEPDAKCRAMISDAPDADKKKKPMRAVTRYALVAALSVALLFGTLIAVQAAGFDIFGSIATWTDSVFRFHNDYDDKPTDLDESLNNPIKTALRELGIPEDLSPVWLPDGYEFHDVVASDREDPFGIVAGVAEKAGSPSINIVIKRSNQQEFISTELEKETTTPILYTTNSRTFYVFENTGTWTGIWSDSEYSISIYNVSTKEQLISIIDSIGGNSND